MLPETESIIRLSDICLHTSLMYFPSVNHTKVLCNVLGYNTIDYGYYDGPLINVYDGDYEIGYVSSLGLMTFNSNELRIIIEERCELSYPTQYCNFTSTDSVYDFETKLRIQYPDEYIEKLHNELKMYCKSISSDDNEYFPVIFVKRPNT